MKMVQQLPKPAAREAPLLKAGHPPAGEKRPRARTSRGSEGFKDDFFSSFKSFIFFTARYASWAETVV